MTTRDIEQDDLLVAGFISAQTGLRREVVIKVNQELNNWTDTFKVIKAATQVGKHPLDLAKEMKPFRKTNKTKRKTYMTLQDLAQHIREEAEYKSDGKSGSTITVLIPVAEAETIAQALEAHKPEVRKPDEQ